MCGRDLAGATRRSHNNEISCSRIRSSLICRFEVRGAMLQATAAADHHHNAARSGSEGPQERDHAGAEAAATIQGLLRGKQARKAVADAATTPIFDAKKGIPQMCLALVAMFTYLFWLLALYQVEIKYPLRQALLSEQGYDKDAIMKLGTTDAVWTWLLDFMHRQTPSVADLATRKSRVVATTVAPCAIRGIESCE